MKIKGLVVIFCGILGIASFSFWNHRDYFRIRKHLPPKENGYFVPVPIFQSQGSVIPHLNAAIGDENFIAQLDLGLKADACIQKDFLKKLKKKNL